MYPLNRSLLWFCLLLVWALAGLGVYQKMQPKVVPISAPVVVSTPTPILPQAVSIRTQLLNDTNKQRELAGLSDVVEDSTMDASAQTKCDDMATNNYFAHLSPGGLLWYQQYPFAYRKAGENLAESYSVSSVTTAWINSPEHRSNILDGTYTQVGFAVCGTLPYIVQHFRSV